MVQAIYEMKCTNVTIVYANDKFNYNHGLSNTLKDNLENKGLRKVDNVSVEHGTMGEVVNRILNDRYDVIVILGSAYFAKSLLRTIDNSEIQHNPVLMVTEQNVPKSFCSDNSLMKIKKRR